MWFLMNDIAWEVIFVNPNDFALVDRTGTLTLATTDPVDKCVYISNVLHGELLERVIKHELAHCVMISYNLLPDIYRMVKKRYIVEAEEWICNFLADYSKIVWRCTDEILRKSQKLQSSY